MIRNNLAVLLAERQIKITRVAKDTGISRSTVTSIAQNDTKMIQLEVINNLCMYLNIEPKDFFVYIPIDVEYNLMFENIDFELDHTNEDLPVKINDFSFDLFIDATNKTESNSKKTYELNGRLKKISIDEDLYPFSHYDINVDLLFPGDKNKENSSREAAAFVKEVWNKLDPTFRITIRKELTNVIKDEIAEKIVEYFSENAFFKNKNSKESELKWLSTFYKSSNVTIDYGIFSDK